MKVLKIGADWCSGCIVMKPRWAEIEKENPRLETRYLDYDNDKEKLKELGIDAAKLPTFIFIDSNGEELERMHGEIDKDKLLNTIHKYKDK